MLKLSTELYTLAVEKGYPEEIGCPFNGSLEGVSVPLNNTAEEVENWIRDEKNFIPAVHCISKNHYMAEVRIFTKYGTQLFKYGKEFVFNKYDQARLKSIEIALNQL